MKTLDLNAILKDSETFPVKLLDGTTINLLKPTQALLIEMTSLSTKGDEFEADPTLAIESLYSICGKIMNNNREGFDIDVNEYPTEVVLAVITAYQEFAQEVLSNPNSKSPANQPQVQAKKGSKR